MQQPALRCVYAAKKSGVQAEGFRPYLNNVSLSDGYFDLYTQMSHTQMLTYGRPSQIFSALEIQHEHVFRLHHLLLNA